MAIKITGRTRFGPIPVDVPTTTSTTTSTTTAAASQATLTFSFINNAGAVSLALNVTSGTILDNIGYFGSARGWTNPGCDTGQISPDESYNNTLFAPSTSTSTQIWGSGSAVLSASLMQLLINGLPINTPDEYITYNGHVYRVIGFGICLVAAPTTTSTTTSTTTAAPTTTTSTTTSTTTAAPTTTTTTSTTTAAPTTTTTSTTTSTTTAGTYRINVYAANQYTPANNTPGNNSFNIQYSTDAGVTWLNLATDIATTSCTSFGYLDRAAGSNTTFRIVNSGTVSTIIFDRSYTSVCPSLAYLYCAEAIVAISSDVSLAFTVQVDYTTGLYSFC